MVDNKVISAFDTLGRFLGQFSENPFREDPELVDLNRYAKDNFLNIIEKTEYKNPWFTPWFIQTAFGAWSANLTEKKLRNWISAYSWPVTSGNPKRIGLILAGNIPMVGFHDFLSVIMSGHIARIKLSSKDDVILPAIRDVLLLLEPSLEERIEFPEEYLKNMDAVIATGSDNSSRYFDYYFGKYPNIIRKNRNSVAVLTGEETDKELQLLADDIFLYFGLGCRNVSKIYLPEGFDLKRLMDNFGHYQYLANHNKFVNNHDYQKAILLVNRNEFLDNDFLILRNAKSISSPVACLHYEFYNDRDALMQELNLNAGIIQCLVSAADFLHEKVEFGRSQFPELNEYADNMDTIKFLLNLYS